MLCSWFKAVFLVIHLHSQQRCYIKRPSHVSTRTLAIFIKTKASLSAISHYSSQVSCQSLVYSIFLFFDGHTCKYRMFTFTFLLWPSSIHTLSVHCNEKFQKMKKNLPSFAEVWGSLQRHGLLPPALCISARQFLRDDGRMHSDLALQRKNWDDFPVLPKTQHPILTNWFKGFLRLRKCLLSTKQNFP